MALVWLITGCSSGFGEEFVRQISARGDQVVATARRLDSILHLQQPDIACLELDVASDQITIEKVVSKAIAAFGKLDVVVHNAGYGTMGTLEEIE